MLAAHNAELLNTLSRVGSYVYSGGWALCALAVMFEGLRGRWSRDDWPLFMVLGALWPLLILGAGTWLLDNVLSPWAERQRQKRRKRRRLDHFHLFRVHKHGPYPYHKPSPDRWHAHFWWRHTHSEKIP